MEFLNIIVILFLLMLSYNKGYSDGKNKRERKVHTIKFQKPMRKEEKINAQKLQRGLNNILSYKNEEGK